MGTMHYIQKHILDALRTAPSMRYTRLNTGGIESGHFRYHLGQLVKDGYVAQLERGLYALTPKGQSYVDKLSGRSVNPASMPKVITYTLLRDSSVLLLQEKQKQPYMGLLNMVGGKLHEGELAADAAVREVHEKTGVTIRRPELAGIFEIIISSSSGLLTHAIAYVFVGDVRRSDFKHETIKAIPEAELATVPNLAPDFLPIFEKVGTAGGIQTASFELHI